MARSVVIEVGRVPDKVLLPNQRRKGTTHWSTVNDATTALRTQAGADSLNADVDRLLEPVIVDYLVRWPLTRYSLKRKLPDVDGLPIACKAILDGLVDKGVIRDDSADVVIEVRARQERTDGDGCVIVTITETEAA